MRFAELRVSEDFQKLALAAAGTAGSVVRFFRAPSGNAGGHSPKKTAPPSVFRRRARYAGREVSVRMSVWHGLFFRGLFCEALEKAQWL